jgi:hypothetical protein
LAIIESIDMVDGGINSGDNYIEATVLGVVASLGQDAELLGSVCTGEYNSPCHRFVMLLAIAEVKIDLERMLAESGARPS